jgi:hypothetical protein
MRLIRDLLAITLRKMSYYHNLRNRLVANEK